MSELPISAENHEGAEYYLVRLTGHLDDRWLIWFDCLSFTHVNDGTTILCLRFKDQSALHGLLRKVRDLGIPLISVIRIESQQ